MDFVANWFIKSAEFMCGYSISAAFVATNSIVQGEQVSLLWSYLINRYDIRIFFAHRTFKWSNEARGNAAVHCVIIGFINVEPQKCRLFDYEKISGEFHETHVKRINPYLVDGAILLLRNAVRR